MYVWVAAFSTPVVLNVQMYNYYGFLVLSGNEIKKPVEAPTILVYICTVVDAMRSSNTGSVPSPDSFADRVLYEDVEIVGPVSLSMSLPTSQQASQEVQQAATKLHHKLYVTVNRVVFV